MVISLGRIAEIVAGILIAWVIIRLLTGAGI
jgi:hypothetical protein